MGKPARVVRLSSKGQIVIPADVRRRAKLRAGDALVVRSGARREIIFTPAEELSQDLDKVLRDARKWFASWKKKTGRDPLEEFHERRRKERELEAKKK